MPLTALLNGSRRLDITVVDDATWAEIYRVQPPAQLTCIHCGGRMSAKRRLGTRHFAHHPGADCALAGRESPEHLRLKELLVTSVRDAGWRGELEAPVGRRRTDVLATSPDGTERVAFEVQLSHQRDDDIDQRTQDCAADGAQVIWVVKDVRRLGGWQRGPWLELREDVVTGPLGRLAVEHTTEQCGGRAFRISRPHWKPPPHHPKLQQLVQAILAYKVCWLQLAARWVPSSELKRFDDAARHQAEVESRLRECHEEQRARLEAGLAVWRTRREQAAKQVAAKLEERGHGKCRIDLEERRSLAKAARVYTEAGMQFLVCPMPRQIFQANQRALRVSAGLVAATARQLEALKRAGVRRAVIVDGFEPPAPGHLLPEAAAEVIRTLERKAAAADVSLQGPDWDASYGGWWMTAETGVRFFIVAPRERPSTIAANVTDDDVWLVFARARDLRDSDKRALTREQIHPDMLRRTPATPPEPQPPHPLEVAAVPIEAARPSSRGQRSPVMAAADELYSRLPRGTATGHSPVQGLDPTLVRRVRIPDGGDIIVTTDATSLPGDIIHDRVVLSLAATPMAADVASTIVTTVDDAVAAFGRRRDGVLDRGPASNSHRRE